jgi:hypothetical protein
LLAKARKLARDLERYAAFGYVTNLEDYQADDRKLLRGIDSLYDLARKHGLSEDPDVQQYRTVLRETWMAARERASSARSSLYQAQARSAGAPRRPLDGYDEELRLARIKGKL